MPPQDSPTSNRASEASRSKECLRQTASVKISVAPEDNLSLKNRLRSDLALSSSPLLFPERRVGRRQARLRRLHLSPPTDSQAECYAPTDSQAARESRKRVSDR